MSPGRDQNPAQFLYTHGSENVTIRPMAEPHRNRITVFTRYPVAGQTKTRLIPAIGAEAAADLQRDMSGRTMLVARVAALQNDAALCVIYKGGCAADMESWLGRGADYRPPGPGDLGAAMLAGFESAQRDGVECAITIGSDCPGISPAIIQQAFEALKTHDVVLGPTDDGGYYLIGMKTPHAELFRGINWGSDGVLNDTRRAIQRQGLIHHELDMLSDVDFEPDLAHWEAARTAPPVNGRTRLSIVIPALNESALIARAVDRVLGCAHEVIVVDGKSSDDTATEARRAGAQVVSAAGTRGSLLNLGAWHATGDVLLFLHADTLLPDDFVESVYATVLRGEVAGGAFSFAIEHPALKYRMVEILTNLRSRALRLPYGDQGLFMSRATFHRLGGFSELPIMEDFELVTRLRRRGQVVTLPQTARTSARRWQSLGLVRTALINQRMLWNYHQRCDPDTLRRLYRREQGVS